MADGSVDLAIRIPVDTADLLRGAQAVRQLAEAEKTAAQAAAEMAAKQKAAADATRFLETTAARGNEIERLALNYRRLNEEMRAAVAAGGDAATAQRAQSVAAREFAAAIAAHNAPVKAATVNTVALGEAHARASGNIGGVVRQLNDVIVMASMGASPLQILTTQGEQMAFALREAGLTGGRLAAALPAVASAAGAVAVAAAAAGTAWVVYQNWALDGAQATEHARDAMIDAGREAAALGTSLSDAASKGWDKFAASARKTTADLEVLTGAVGRATAAASRDAEQLRAEAAPALLELGKRQVEITRALNEAVAEANRGGSGAAEAAATAAALRPQLAAVTEELGRRKEALRQAIDETTALGAATDANAAADERARAAAAALAEAKRRQAEAERREREEAALRLELARKHLAAIEAEVAGIGAYYDVVDGTASIRAALASSIDAITEARRNQIDVTNQAAMAEADLALALSQGSISLEEYQARLTQLRTSAATGGGSTTGAQTALQGPSAGVSAISQAGPWGALIAGIIKAIKDGLANLGNSFETYHEDLMSGLATIGSDLGDNIGRWISEGTKAFTTGLNDFLSNLIASIPDIITGMVEGLVSAMGTLDFWFPLVRGLLEGLGRLVTDIISGKAEKSGAENRATYDKNKAAWWDDLGSGRMTWDEFWSGQSPNANNPKYAGLRAGGGYISDPGLYQLHRGEVVYNRSRTAQADQQLRAPASVGGRARMFGMGGRAYFEVDLESLSSTLTQASRNGLTFGGA